MSLSIFKRSLFLLLMIMCMNICYCLPPEVRAKGFVYLHEIDPTIRVSLRYASNENFLGKPVNGYNKSVVILTEQTAQALKRVQQEVDQDGYSLVIYDGYRPQQAVDHFMVWSKDISDQSRKAQYYPRVNKEDVFDLGYVMERSGHSRGSTVDLTIIKKDTELHEIIPTDRTLLDGFTIQFLDDGTLDMGSSFDLFDEASHFENDLIGSEFKERRTYLKNVMKKHGFKSCSQEWWHFTLANEPFARELPESYFNFVIE